MSEPSKEEQNLSLELTVLSADSLKSSSSIFPFRLRPYVAVSTTFAPETIFSTSIDETGTTSPTFKETFNLPLSPSFLNPSSSKTEHNNDFHVSILSKRPLLLGPTELGWCRICASDIMDGYQPPSVRRRLSYSLRSPQDGCKGLGYVHVAARVVGTEVDRWTVAKPVPQPQPGWSRLALGIPVGIPVGTSVPMLPGLVPVSSVPVGRNGEMWSHSRKRKRNEAERWS